MTYQEFLDMEYETNKKAYYYRRAYTVCHRKEDAEKYRYYRRKKMKMADFKSEVLAEALKNISKYYFE